MYVVILYMTTPAAWELGEDHEGSTTVEAVYGPFETKEEAEAQADKWLEVHGDDYLSYSVQEVKKL